MNYGLGHDDRGHAVARDGARAPRRGAAAGVRRQGRARVARGARASTASSSASSGRATSSRPSSPGSGRWSGAGEQIGRVTDAVWSPRLERNIGYAWVPIELADPGTQHRRRVRARPDRPWPTAAIPFVDPRKEVPAASLREVSPRPPARAPSDGDARVDRRPPATTPQPRGSAGRSSLVERGTKEAMWDCRMCGQCILHSTGLSCPMRCPKNLRNGPCGGVLQDGSCEVLPEMTVRVGRGLGGLAQAAALARPHGARRAAGRTGGCRGPRRGRTC